MTLESDHFGNSPVVGTLTVRVAVRTCTTFRKGIWKSNTSGMMFEIKIRKVKKTNRSREAGGGDGRKDCKENNSLASTFSSVTFLNHVRTRLRNDDLKNANHVHAESAIGQRGKFGEEPENAPSR